MRGLLTRASFMELQRTYFAASFAAIWATCLP